MLKVALLPGASILATLIAGCAVGADPSSTGSTAVAADGAEHPTAHSSESVVINPIVPICLPPITAMTGNWSCGSTGVRTGEKTATTVAGYTNNCSGRATVEFSTPSCPVPAAPAYYEINVSSAALANLTAAQCAEAYLDYTIWGESSTSSAWTESVNARVYGEYSGGYCFLQAPTYYPLVSQWSNFEISADAYEPYFAHIRGGTIQLGMTPVNVTFDASFIQ